MKNQQSIRLWHLGIINALGAFALAFLLHQGLLSWLFSPDNRSWLFYPACLIGALLVSWPKMPTWIKVALLSSILSGYAAFQAIHEPYWGSFIIHPLSGGPYGSWVITCLFGNLIAVLYLVAPNFRTILKREFEIPERTWLYFAILGWAPWITALSADILGPRFL